MEKLQYSKPQLYLILISSTGSMPWDMWRTPSTQTPSAGWKGAGRRRPPRTSQPAALRSPSRRFLPPKKVQFPALKINCIWDTYLIHNSHKLSSQGRKISHWAGHSLVFALSRKKAFISNLPTTGHSNNFRIKNLFDKLILCMYTGLSDSYRYFSHSEILFYMSSWALSRLSRFRVNATKNPLCV